MSNACCRNSCRDAPSLGSTMSRVSNGGAARIIIATLTHEDARRHYAHFDQREWARLAKSRRRLEFTSGMHCAAAPALLRRYSAAADASRWTQQEPVGWHHGQQLFAKRSSSAAVCTRGSLTSTMPA